MEIQERPDGMTIDVGLIVAYGVRLIALPHRTQQSIKYANSCVEKTIGLPVVEMIAHI
ncbi:MAG: hypothetical protein RMK32_04730 [Anaerolineae bacterium]|nr:Asp23/Gls24 family envelope stress response protein [Thermoflexus sp.]MDW8064916.1 hypothetical protein [Anaerolineae bacterium]